jgi:integrase
MKLSPFVAQILPSLDIREKTRKNYEGCYQRHLAPYLGHRDLSEVSKNDLLTSLDPLPPQTKYQTLMTARVIFREAVSRELIERNPAATIKAPRLTVKPGKFLTWEELQALDFGRQTKRIRFLALHGCRYGEAAALTENDIHDGLVHITKSKYGPTKSKSGVRKVPHLSEFESFAQHQNGIARALKPHGVTVHSLRKTYAYTLKSAAIHVTTAAKLMGHSNPMITLNIYTQVRDNEIGESKSAIQNYMDETLKRTTHSTHRL